MQSDSLLQVRNRGGREKQIKKVKRSAVKIEVRE